MTTASHTMIARTVGRSTERRGFIVLSVGALVLLTSIAAQLALTRPTVDATHQAQ